MAPCSSLTTPAARSGTTTVASDFTSAPLFRIIARTIALSPTPTPRASATASCSIQPPSSSQGHHDLTNSFSSPNNWSPPRSITLPRPMINQYTQNAYKCSKNSFLPTLPTLPSARPPTPLRLQLRPPVTARAPTRHRPGRIQFQGSCVRIVQSRRPIYLHRRRQHHLEHLGVYVNYVSHRPSILQSQ